MKIVHLSDIHVWRYTWNLRHLLGRRALGMMELLTKAVPMLQNVCLSTIDETVSATKDEVG